MSALTERWMDELEPQFARAATRVGERLRTRRRTHRIAAAAVATILLLTGAALAEQFDPIASFKDLLSAQRAVTPADALPADLRTSLERLNEHGPDHFALDQARLLAQLPDGGRLYAIPSAGGDLCLLASTGGMACGPPISADVPLMWMASSKTNHDTLVVGLVRDDVRAVAITMGGLTETVPVHDNTFWYQESSAAIVPTLFVAELADGSTVEIPTGVAP
jgi:hypothetical protein